VVEVVTDYARVRNDCELLLVWEHGLGGSFLGAIDEFVWRRER